MRKQLSYFERSITAARITLGGRTSEERPHSIPSSKTISGIRMTLDALKRIKDEIEAVNPDFLSKVYIKAFIGKSSHRIEQFNSKMRYSYERCQQFNNSAISFLQ